MRLKSLYLLTVVASALFAAGCALGPYRDPNYDPAWPTIEPVGDLETVGNLRPELLWYTETDEPMWSVPVLVGDVVYVSGDEQVYALNSDNGEVLWLFETEDLLDGNLAVAGGAVYTGSYHGSLFVLDAGSGELLWRYAPGSWVYGTAVADGAVYIATADDHVHALRAVNGALIWRVHPGLLDSGPVVANGAVFVGGRVEASYAEAAYALDADSGALLWSWFESDTAYFFAPSGGTPVLASGLFMRGLPDLYFDTLEADDGVVFASKQLLTEDPDTPYTTLKVAEGVVYLAIRANGIYALDAITGNLIWHFDDNEFGYPAGLRAAPAVVDGVVYAGA